MELVSNTWNEYIKILYTEKYKLKSEKHWILKHAEESKIKIVIYDC